MTGSKTKHTKQSAGRLGGQATVARHGPGHMAKIGRKGAQALHDRYNLTPFGIGDFALVNKETGQVRAFLSGTQVARV